MGKIIRKLKQLRALTPSFPRKRYNIFVGSNTWSEWLTVFKALWKRKSFDDAAVIKNYETEFAKSSGVSNAISFGAGRMSLYAILKALDIGSDDEVIISGFTCVVVPNAVLYCGAIPVYSDIDLQTFNQIPGQLESHITPRTKAIVAQHTFGTPCDLDEILGIGVKYNIPIIEDCGHAQGALYKGKPVGSIGVAGFFTTDHTKITGTHLGGMVTTNSPELARALRKIQEESPFLEKKDYDKIALSFLLEFPLYSPISYWIGRSLLVICYWLGLLFYWKDESLTIKSMEYPYPARLSSIQATIGISQLANLHKNLAHRRNIATLLEHKFKRTSKERDHQKCSAWLRYSFLVKDRLRFEKKFRQELDLGIWFTSVVHGRDANLEQVRYSIGSCPNAEFAAQHVVNFPTHQRIPISLIENVVDRDLTWIMSQMIIVNHSGSGNAA